MQTKRLERFAEYLVAVVILVVLGMLMLPGIRSGPASPRTQCLSTLRNLNLALQSYYSDHGSFPPAYITDESGRPMHSWRVLILPYLEMQDLYDRYRFDEPWNGPNNSQLGDFVPQIYTCPTDLEDRKPGQFWTSYVAVVGPHSCWPGAEAVQLDEVTDGQNDTLTIVEVLSSGIHWMEPRDLHIVQMVPTINAQVGQGISSLHNGGANAAFVDGSARFLPETMRADAVRQLIDIDDGGPQSQDVP